MAIFLENNGGDSHGGRMESETPFAPFIAPERRLPEFTLRATVLGIILGLIFNVGNTYLGLRVGITVSASIPAAVLSMAILRLFFRDVSVLENNIVQTVATVGEGLAAGVIFTVPALFFLGAEISNWKIFVLSMLGGILGILFMIPMRRYIIVKEHGILPFPEGTACAKILEASNSGKNQALMAVGGIIVGALYKICTGVLLLWNDMIQFVIKPFQHTQFRMDGTPALFGVGFIIGPWISSLTFAGGAMSWWVFIPLIKMYGTGGSAIFPGTLPISEMSALEIWSNYVRYIGIGTVAIGGLYNLLRIAPMIGKTVHVGFRELFEGFHGSKHLPRTDRDISMAWLILGSITIVLLLWLLPLNMNIFTIILLVVLGYFFVAVTSITVGLVGSSSNPASGMVLTTLLITGLIFAALGWTERIYLIMAITMSTVVNIAICLAATTSQDLKTGFLLGATPRWQQLSEMIGLILPSCIIGLVLMLLNQAYGFGSAQLPAPQATMLFIIAKGVIAHQLPTTLVVLGAILGIILLILRIPILPFAIGLYLPLEISTAMAVGGITRALIEKKHTHKAAVERGILAASGLVAGDACFGVVIALLTVAGTLPSAPTYYLNNFFGLAFFLLLALGFIWFSLHRPSAKKQ